MEPRDKLYDLVRGIKNYYEDLEICIDSVLETDEQVLEMIDFIEKNPNVTPTRVSLKSLDLTK